MSALFDKLHAVNARFKRSKNNLQEVVRTVDELRSNSKLPAVELDEYYSCLEEINAESIYQNRSLNSDEIEEVLSLVEKIEDVIK